MATRSSPPPSTRLVAGLLDERAAARAAKDFARADAIRDQIRAAGIEIEDTPDGPKWSWRSRVEGSMAWQLAQRKGAIRKTSKKPAVGSGGQVRRGLEGKGPTPKAKDRPYHKAHKQAARAEREEAKKPRRRTTKSTDAEWVAGRNSVLEVLRAGVPVNGVYVAEGAERDGRLRDAFALAAESGISLLEVTRAELDRMTGGAVHQGLAARIPAYEYAHADDLLGLASASGSRPLIVALDSVTDPRNLGAVIRSAAGFGAHGVLIPERRAAGMTASAWKTSAGAAARIPVAQTRQPGPPAQGLPGRGLHGGRPGLRR